MKFLNKRILDYLYILILSITTIYIWHPLTKLILQWESYTYLNKEYYLPLFTKTLLSFANFDVQSMLVGSSLSKLFGVNMPLYFWIEIFSILIINLLVYFLVKTLTKSTTSGFIASFIFTLYFFNIGFFLPNWYATFVQRVIINVPLLLVSFLFLHRYLSEKKSKYYFISVFLFCLSIFLAHFGILLAFPVFFYPFFWEIFSSFHVRSILKAFLTIIPFTVITIFFLTIQYLWGERLGPKESFLYFLTHPGTYHYIEGVVRQLVYMTQYATVIKAILSGHYALAFSDPKSTYALVFPIVFLYIICIIVIWKNEKKLRALLLTIISSFIISLTVNIYMSRFDFLADAGVNRYYYYPSFLLAIFWALLLTSIFSKKGHFIIGSILGVFFLVNEVLFSQFFSDLNHYSMPTIRLYQYIVRNINELPSNSLIIVGPTADFGPYETTFVTEQLGEKRGITFATEDRAYPKWKDLATTAPTILRVYYDSKCACVQKEVLK